MRASRPFPLEKQRDAPWPWPGVKAPDKLRDDPGHPHASFPGGHKNTFADGGLIGGGFNPEVKPLPAANFNKGGKVRNPDPKILGAGEAQRAGSKLKGRRLKLLNAERAAEGLPPLKHDPDAPE